MLDNVHEFEYKYNTFKCGMELREVWFDLEDTCLAAGLDASRVKSDLQGSEYLNTYNDRLFLHERALFDISENKNFLRFVYKKVFPIIRRSGEFCPGREDIQQGNIDKAALGLEAMSLLSYGDRLKVARKLLAQGVDISRLLAETLRKELRYYNMREIAKRGMYTRIPALRKAFVKAGLMDEYKAITEEGRKYGTYDENGDCLWRLEVVDLIKRGGLPEKV